MIPVISCNVSTYIMYWTKLKNRNAFTSLYLLLVIVKDEKAIFLTRL